MTRTKPWYKSRGCWGSLLALAASAASLPLVIDPATGDFSGNLYQLATSLAGIAGGAAGWFGRTRAVTAIAARIR